MSDGVPARTLDIRDSIDAAKFFCGSFKSQNASSWLKLEGCIIRPTSQICYAGTLTTELQIKSILRFLSRRFALDIDNVRIDIDCIQLLHLTTGVGLVAVLAASIDEAQIGYLTPKG